MKSCTNRLTEAIHNDVLISWIEPDDDPKEVAVWFASAGDCVKLAKEYTSANKEFRYQTDEDALGDFVVVHWADIEDGRTD